MVPWLGFERGKARTVMTGLGKFEARIGLDLKFKFIDLTKNKAAASLPKNTAKEILAEFKEHAAALKEVVRAQNLRLEKSARTAAALAGGTLAGVVSRTSGAEAIRRALGVGRV